MHDIGPEMTS